MRKSSITIDFELFDNMEQLNAADRELVSAARKACEKSYSPFSHFSVGAAVRLDDGKIITGANQENAAFPSGLCAERVA
ncbi:MAG TPA: cytidine deaminase, partial [Candidatus Onthomorpha intestinigallinarum]|nr:cytidine deaminase [Candidatus Onthomorpha intestinigallinarum]